MFQHLLNALPEWGAKIIDFFKALLTALYIRRSTRIESERDALHDANTIKDKQLEISASLPADPDDLRDRMRDNEF